MDIENNLVQRIGKALLGDSADYSFENRVFNAVGIVSLFGLAVAIVINLSLGLPGILSEIIGTVLLIQVILYYQSRFRKRYKTGVIVYSVCSYLLLASVYYYNGGIDGPTIFIFFLTIQLIVAIVPKQQNWFWVGLHVVVVTLLLLSEYINPGIVRNTYLTRQDRFTDMITSYAAIMISSFFIMRYMRRSYHRQRESAIEKARAIELQNEQITQQKTELEKTNEEKTKLFSIIAHDLRSPLNSIQSFLELLSEHQLEQDEKLFIERELLSLTKNTSDMLYNLLSWSKAQMDGVSVKCIPLNVCDTLCKNIDIQKTIAHKKLLTLNSHIDPSIRVLADADMLQLVVRNIINNAIKFTPSGGDITIDSMVYGDEFQLAVKDNGIGISFEQQNELFSLKTKSSFGTNNEKGIGLGLVLCKEFIELQGGRIWFQSIPKHGTAFYISLPLSPALQN